MTAEKEDALRSAPAYLLCQTESYSNSWGKRHYRGVLRCLHCGDTLHWLGAGWSHDRDNMASCIPEYERTGKAVTARPAGAPTLTAMPLDDQTARELSRAAANVRTWTGKRNTLIRQAFEAGAGVREIAKATGLNVGTVHTMLHGRKR